VFAVLLQFLWMTVTVVLSVAVLYLLLIDRMIDSGVKCVNLKHYGKDQPIKWYQFRHLFIWAFGNKKLSYRRETARQLPTWRGLSPPVHSPSPLATPMRTVES